MEAGPSQCLDLVPPGIPRFRPAMRQDDQWFTNCTGLSDPHVQAIIKNYPGLDRHYPAAVAGLLAGVSFLIAAYRLVEALGNPLFHVYGIIE